MFYIPMMVDSSYHAKRASQQAQHHHKGRNRNSRGNQRAVRQAGRRQQPRSKTNRRQGFVEPENPSHINGL